MYLLYEIDYFDDNQHRQEGKNGKIIFNILGSSTELTTMTKYIIGEISSSGGANLYKNPSHQTVRLFLCFVFMIFRRTLKLGI